MLQLNEFNHRDSSRAYMKNTSFISTSYKTNIQEGIKLTRGCCALFILHGRCINRMMQKCACSAVTPFKHGHTESS